MIELQEKSQYSLTKVRAVNNEYKILQERLLK